MALTSIPGPYGAHGNREDLTGRVDAFPRLADAVAASAREVGIFDRLVDWIDLK